MVMREALWLVLPDVENQVNGMMLRGTYNICMGMGNVAD